VSRFQKYREGNDAQCRSGTKSGVLRPKRGKRPESGRINRGLINQKDRDVVANRIEAVAAIAFEGFGIRFEDKRLLADRADQDFEQVLRNHEEYCTTGAAGRVHAPAGLRSLEWQGKQISRPRGAEKSL
jgi:hypothetical protein